MTKVNLGNNRNSSKDLIKLKQLQESLEQAKNDNSIKLAKISVIKKALYYERVSTVNEDQTSSLENQRKLCEKFLSNHPEIMLAEPIDTYSERESGKTDQRKKYMQMMVRLSKGDIDYLIVKDLKRLNRSTEVSAQLRNACRKYGFVLILLETGQIYDPNAESNRMLYGFESLVNEEVVYRQSTYGRIAHQQKMDAKRLNAQNCTFGYRWDSQKQDMVICEKEAAIIREVFDLLIFKDYGIKEIRNELAQKGVLVCTNTISNWLNETAYIGCFHMNKKGSELGVGAGQKTKRYTNPRQEWVAVERPDLKILDEEIFALAQRIRNSRRLMYAPDKNGFSQTRFTGVHLFSSKVFCAECGKSFVHYWCDRARTVSAYKDSYLQKTHDPLVKCQNMHYNRIYEEELAQITLSAINGFIKENQACFDLLIKVLRKSIEKVQHEDNEILRARRSLAALKKEQEHVMDSYLEASGSLKNALADKYEALSQEIEQLQIIADRDIGEEKSMLDQRITKIKQRMEGLKEIKTLDRNIINHFIKRIEITKTGDVTVIIDTENVYDYKIRNWEEHKEATKKPLFIMPKMRLKYRFNVQFYESVVTKLNQGDRCSKPAEDRSPRSNGSPRSRFDPASCGGST